VSFLASARPWRARWLLAEDATDVAVRVIGCFLRSGRTQQRSHGYSPSSPPVAHRGRLLISLEHYLESGRLLRHFLDALTAEAPVRVGDSLLWSGLGTRAVASGDTQRSHCAVQLPSRTEEAAQKMLAFHVGPMISARQTADSWNENLLRLQVDERADS
jgi:hypothetical protein